MRAFVYRWAGTGAGWQAFPANLVYYSGGWRTTDGFGIVSLGSRNKSHVEISLLMASGV